MGAAAVFPRLARAQAAAPTAPIVALNTALIAVMKAGDSAPFARRYQMLAPAIDQGFDLPRIIAISVGSYWASLPAGQQQKLRQVFRSFIIANYVANFHSYAGEVAAVSPTTRAVGAQQVVTSTLTKPSGDVLRIDYVMGQTGSGWQVQDILLDGTISRVAVQRSDFSSLLSQGDATQLIASLEQKVTTLSGGAISA
jgi:phospholipid transport system substrate-binding protein